ncbi:hypothetical protein K2X33_09420 [bacterium]|nr:hypothetical protein [bacterium]
MQKRLATFALITALLLPSYAGSIECPAAYAALEGAKRGYRVLQNAYAAVRPYLAGRDGKLFHFDAETGISKAVSLAQDLGKHAWNWGFPGIYRWETQTDAVFRKLWKKPDYKPSPAEWALLKKHGMADRFRQRAQFLQTHPRFRLGRRGLEHATNAGLKALWGLVLNYHHHLNAEPALSLENYVDQGDHAPAEDEVQLLLETVPFPHMAIRIGKTVYNYGLTNLNEVSLQEYMSPSYVVKQLQDPQAVRSLFEAQGLTGKALEARMEEFRKTHPQEQPSFVQKMLLGVADPNALGQLARTVHVITLKIGKKEREELQTKLALDVGKRYFNVTSVNDCSTMTLRALGKDFGVLDASPSTAGMLFALKKSLGDSSVGSIFQVNVDSSGGTSLRDSYIHFLDGSYHLTMLPAYLPARLYVDATHSSEDLQFLEPGIAAELEKWKKDTVSKLEQEKSISLLRGEIALIENAPEGDKPRLKKALQRDAKFFLPERMALVRGRLDDPNTSMPARHAFQAEWEYLTELDGAVRKLQD